MLWIHFGDPLPVLQCSINVVPNLNYCYFFLRCLFLLNPSDLSFFQTTSFFFFFHQLKWNTLYLIHYKYIISTSHPLVRKHMKAVFRVCATHIVLSGVGLQHGSEEPVGKAEAGQPEQVGRLERLGPAGKLVDPLAEIPGPSRQGLQRGEQLVGREGDGETRQIHSQLQLSVFKK